MAVVLVVLVVSSCRVLLTTINLDTHVSCSERVQQFQPSPRAYFAVNEGYRSVSKRKTPRI